MHPWQALRILPATKTDRALTGILQFKEVFEKPYSRLVFYVVSKILKRGKVL